MTDLLNLPTGITLTELTSLVTKAVTSRPELFGAWVIAELSDVRMSGGHCYMELIEKNVSGQTVAKLRATVWQSYFSQIRQKFLKATGREISTGIKVLLRGNINHHALYGLSFNITDIDPSYTLGDLERLRREILARLQKEGILDANKNRQMPLAPQRIAVISAEGAAGYGDFINQLSSNRDGFVFYPFLFPCVMQGDKVSSSVRRALSLIEETSVFWDCVAIVRGGGATTDLNGFDDYELAHAVALCKLPVIVGIGHERDRNVLDEIAHTRVKTPTAVAGFFIDRLREAYKAVRDNFDRIREYAFANLAGEERRLTSLGSMLPQLVARKISENNANLEKLAQSVPILIKSRIRSEDGRLANYQHLLYTLGSTIVSNAGRNLSELYDRLGRNADTVISLSKKSLDNIESLIGVLNPENTLKRGYSITRVNGKAVSDTSRLKEGDLVVTKLFKGEICSEIKEIR
ncbi:MAG: exodeoxyribonuclease VII large subunit [Muribaculaceae bacterium]|nr:exodeoxyribonuclease VII large subunit [Muribaculaceae bacterium]